MDIENNKKSLNNVDTEQQKKLLNITYITAGFSVVLLYVILAIYIMFSDSKNILVILALSIVPTTVVLAMLNNLKR